jgi:hypothetical protein
LYSGAEYGHFDWFRIIHTIELRGDVTEGKRFASQLLLPLRILAEGEQAGDFARFLGLTDDDEPDLMSF